MDSLCERFINFPIGAHKVVSYSLLFCAWSVVFVEPVVEVFRGDFVSEKGV